MVKTLTATVAGIDVSGLSMALSPGKWIGTLESLDVVEIR